MQEACRAQIWKFVQRSLREATSSVLFNVLALRWLRGFRPFYQICGNQVKMPIEVFGKGARLILVNRFAESKSISSAA
jgi:hypothetical protein